MDRTTAGAEPSDGPESPIRSFSEWMIARGDRGHRQRSANENL